MKKIISDTKKLADKHNIKIILKNQEHVTSGDEIFPSSGFFNDETRELVVAIKKEEKSWLPVFVHESCHLDQFLEDYFLWKKMGVGYDLFFEWLEGGRDLDKKTLSKCLQDIIDCELDCEKRTVRKIKKYKLDIDIPLYIKMANNYLYSYSYVLKYRKWEKDVYRDKKLIELSPSKFQESYLKIPTKLRNQFKKLYEKSE